MSKARAASDRPPTERPILVVDDDRKIAALVRAYLEREGYRVVTRLRRARGGREGARRNAPALIVLDLMLPELDGFEVMRRVRADADVPILMLSARSSLPERIIGPRARRGRLPAQAVQPRRARRARQGHPAPLRPGGRAGDAHATGPAGNVLRQHDLSSTRSATRSVADPSSSR